MTRAQGLSDFAAGLGNTLKVDVNNSRVGINSTVPTTTLDVGGVVNATSFTGTTGTFSGSVSIGGTITYEDVTNIDSVGVITARSGIRVNAGGLVVAGVSTLAADLSITDKIIHTGDTNTAIRFPAADTFTVETAGVERVRVTSDGKMGLGTISPGGKVHIQQSAVTSAPSRNVALYLENNANCEILMVGNSVNDCQLRFGTSSSSFKGALEYQLDVNALLAYVNGSEKMRIDSAGDVGIQIADPGEKLDVNGKIRSHHASDSRFLLRVNDVNKGGFSATTDAGVVIYGASSTNPIRFQVSGGEKARIDTSGRLLVGTTSARTNVVGQTPHVLLEKVNGSILSLINNQASANDAQLLLGKTRGSSIGSNTVVQNGDAIGLIAFCGNDGSIFREGATIRGFIDGAPGSGDMPSRLVFSTTADGASSPTERMRISNGGQMSTFTSSGIGHRIGHASTGNDNNIIQAGKNASNISNMTTTFYVKTDGDVLNANNSYTGISDIRLKENIVDANSQWNDLKSLQVRNYNFKTQTGFQTYTQLGLIAQEVELVSPGLVSESPDQDGEGNDLGTTTKSVNYSVLYMKAVKALQEAMTRIETLETEVAALKG